MPDSDKPPLMFPWINSPHVRRFEAWLWNHPKTAIALTIVSFGLISSPAWFADFWSLFSNEAPVPAIMNWISSLPAISISWYWLPVGVGAAMLTVIIAVFWRERNRLETEVERLKADLLEKSLSAPTPVMAGTSEPTESPYELVHRIADHQAKNIRDFVHVSRVGIWEDKLNDAIPTIKWGLYIKNDSILTVSIVEIRNNVFFEKAELAERRFEDHNEVEQLQYGRDGSIIFKQRLSPIEAQHIRSTPNGKFRFNRLKIKVANPHSVPIIEPQDLTIGDDLETTLNVLTYKETEGMKSLKDESALLKQRVQELEEQAKGGLRFEIDEKRTQVCTTGHSGDMRLVAAKVRLRCSKVGDSKVAIRQFSAALFKLVGNEEDLIADHAVLIAYSEPHMEPFNTEDGWVIDGPLTSYQWFNFTLEIYDGVLPYLTSHGNFFRVTMTAVGQVPQHVDFFVNSWQVALKSNSSITLRPAKS